MESLVFVSPSSCDLQKTYKNQWFFKDFGICSPLGMSCLPLALIMGLSENLEKPVVLKHFGICSPVGISYFRTAFKVHTKSPQDRPKIAQERPKTPQDLQHGANIMPKRGPKRSPRHIRRVSERGFKSDFNLCSHGGTIKNSEHRVKMRPAFMMGYRMLKLLAY